MNEKCHFAHGPEELRKIDDPIPMNAIGLYQKNSFAPNNSTAIPAGHVRSNYKTIPCKFFMESGHCSFGDRCTYAHGESDIRPSIIPVEMAGQEDGVSSQNHTQDNPATNNMNTMDQPGYNLTNSNAYGINHDSSREFTMELNEETEEVKRSIYDTVNCLKSQNYDQAKRIVTELMENGKITFKFADQENDLFIHNDF